MGCTGSPADAHDIRWYTIHKDKLLRCGECGSGKLFRPDVFCTTRVWRIDPRHFFFLSSSLQVGLPWFGRRRA